MPEPRLQLAIEIETEGAEQLTTLRRDLEQLGQTGAAAVTRLDSSLTAVLDHLRQSRQLIAAATDNFLQSHRRLFSSLEPVFQGFFQRLLGGARNFRDALRRLLADLLDFFLRTVSSMVSAWLSGLRQMAAVGGAGPLAGVALPLLSAGLGFPAGPGGTPPTFPPAGGGGASATNIDLLSRLGIDLRSLGPIPGGALASGGLLGVLLGFQRGSRLLGTLGGAATGFAFGGPIGAVVGGIVGFFAGLFGRGRLKRRAARAEANVFAQLKQIVEQFKQFKLDFDSALAQFDALWADFQLNAPRQFGFAGRRAVRNVAPFVAILRRQLLDTQQARQARLRLIETLPIPEFQFGGLVKAIHSQQGKILAFLHEGEAVLNRRAVQRLGPQFIQQANQAPSFQSGGVVARASVAPASSPVKVEVHIHPTPGMSEEQLARFTIRQLDRLLRDRGLTLGS